MSNEQLSMNNVFVRHLRLLPTRHACVHCSLLTAHCSFFTPNSPFPIIFFILVCAAGVHAQNRYGSAYLVPQTVYVGDRAMLVLPLPGVNSAGEVALVPESPGFPSLPELELHRIVLERRPSGSRLTIEFAAYAPGLFELPPLEIGGETFSGIRLEVSSIIGGADTVLSGPLPPAPVPGTGLLVYGALSCLILCLFFVLWAAFWGRRNFAGWFAAYKRRRLIASMWGVERHLRKSLLQGAANREILDALSVQFRSFLTIFTGENCRAMTACEFRQLDKGKMPDEMQAALNGGFLEYFFRRCDDARFDGLEIVSEGVAALLGDLRSFLQTLNMAVRSRRHREEKQ